MAIHLLYESGESRECSKGPGGSKENPSHGNQNTGEETILLTNSQTFLHKTSFYCPVALGCPQSAHPAFFSRAENDPLCLVEGPCAQQCYHHSAGKLGGRHPFVLTLN